MPQAGPEMPVGAEGKGYAAELSAAAFAPGRQLRPEELRLLGERLFGAWGWQTRLAEVLEVDGSTVRRWVSGAVGVPPPAKVAIRLLLEREGLAATTSDRRNTRLQTADRHALKQPTRPRTTRRAS